jgi:hypothetical protein
MYDVGPTRVKIIIDKGKSTTVRALSMMILALVDLRISFREGTQREKIQYVSSEDKI